VPFALIHLNARVFCFFLQQPFVFASVSTDEVSLPLVRDVLITTCHYFTSVALFGIFCSYFGGGSCDEVTVCRNHFEYSKARKKLLECLQLLNKQLLKIDLNSEKEN
jgi:hypothetical protein